VAVGVKMTDHFGTLLAGSTVESKNFSNIQFIIKFSTTIQKKRNFSLFFQYKSFFREKLISHPISLRFNLIYSESIVVRLAIIESPHFQI
jgi:hypothetical protein